jgi:hypothetical protein
MTSKGMMVGLVSVALAACAARPAIQATPAQRAQAVGIVVCGDRCATSRPSWRSARPTPGS